MSAVMVATVSVQMVVDVHRIREFQNIEAWPQREKEASRNAESASCVDYCTKNSAHLNVPGRRREQSDDFSLLFNWP